MLFTALLVAAVGPIYWLITMATNTSSEINRQHPLPFPSFSGFGGITNSGHPIFRWFLNSFEVGIGTALISVGIGVLAGYGLSRFRFRGAGTFGYLVFATQMLPATLLVVPLYSIFQGWHLIGGVSSVILAGSAFSMPVVVWITKNAVDAIPAELDEAALVDGASIWSRFWTIALPLARPAIAASFIISFFGGWNDFIFANTFLIAENNWTITKGLASMFGEYTVPANLIMASALLFAIMPVALFIMLQRRIVGGLTAGAVRG